MKIKVAIVPCKSYNHGEVNKAIEEAIELLGGLGSLIKPGQKTFLKPNLLMKYQPESMVTTHPGIVAAVANMVKNHGAEVLVGDSPGGPYNPKALQGVYKACGLTDALEEGGIELNYDCDSSKVSHPGGQILKNLNLIKPALQGEFIINLPKLKTHGLTVFTGGVKNLFGCIPGLKKAEYHVNMPKIEDFADALLDINTYLNPGLTIMDGVVGMEGAGPSAGEPKELGVIIASTSAYAVDMVATSLVGIDHKMVPTISRAVARGLSPQNLEEVEIVGWWPDKLPLARFKVPPGAGSNDLLKVATRGWIPEPIIQGLNNQVRSKPVFVHDKCTGCRDCYKSCPPKAIVMEKGRPKVDLSQCIRCYCCQELCPQKAVEIKRPWLGKLLFK